MIVLDASAAVEILLFTAIGQPEAERLLLNGEQIHAPHLLDVEVGQALRKLAARGEITSERARDALADLTDFPIERHAHDLLLERAWQLRDNVTFYDGAYIALAELLDAEVLTCDARLARSPGIEARIRVLA